MKKSKLRLLSLLVVMVLCFSTFSVTAFAGGDGEPTEPPIVTEPTTEPEVTEPTEPVDPTPLTPDGNLTLVDDIEGDKTQGKQFVTLQSKAGNYFYLIIDRDDDKENVYFLNLVDEADLMALIEETPVTPEIPPECICTEKCETGEVNTNCPVCSVNMTACEGVETEPTEEQPEEETGNPMMLLLVVLLLGGIGGGAFYYFKVLKNKPDTKGTTDLNEYDYDEDDEDEYGYIDENDTEDEPSDDEEVKS